MRDVDERDDMSGLQILLVAASVDISVDRSMCEASVSFLSFGGCATCMVSPYPSFPLTRERLTRQQHLADSQPHYQIALTPSPEQPVYRNSVTLYHGYRY